MDVSPTPPDHGETRTAYLLSVTWIQCAISIAFVAVRFYCRARVTHNLWWDDWCILLPLFFVILASSCISVYTSYGGTHHVFDLQPGQISTSLEWNLISLVFCIGAISTGKASVALLIYRLQAPSKWRTWLLGFLSISSLVVAVLIIGLEFAQCTPAKKFWMPMIPGHCWDPKKINDWDIAGSCYWALVDLILALIPITFLWNLKMSLEKKIVLCALLGLGVFAAICGAIKASYLPTLTAKSDATWISVSLLVWNVTEANVIIYAACLPTIRPLLQRSFESMTTHAGSSRGHSTYNTRNGRVESSNKHIKLGSSLSNKADWDPKDDGDSDHAHILKPIPIVRSLAGRSQKGDTASQHPNAQGSWNDRGAHWDQSPV